MTSACRILHDFPLGSNIFKTKTLSLESALVLSVTPGLERRRPWWLLSYGIPSLLSLLAWPRCYAIAPLVFVAALFAAMGELYTRFCIRANIVEQNCKELFDVDFCICAKVRPMKTKDAINLAGSRKQLAALLGVAPISTYRWADLPQKHEDRLRVAKPSWFKAKKGTK